MLLKKMFRNKHGVIAELQGLVGPLVGVAIVLVIGFLIFSEMKDQVVNIQSSDYCGTGFNYYTSVKDCCNSTGGTDNCLGINRSNPAYSAAYNGTGVVQNAMSDVPGWLPIVIVAIIGSLLLTLVAYFRSN